MTDSTQELDEILNDYADEHRNHAYEFDNFEQNLLKALSGSGKE